MKQSNRLRLHNLPSSLKKINWEKYETKKYLHFDTTIQINHFKNYLLNEDKIKSHSFLPFINFEIKFKKYVTISKDKTLPINEQKTKKEKTRLICYASHRDAYIYKYYGDILNNYYSEFARENQIDDNILAYRNNKPGKNNVDFSKEVFEYIQSNENAIIISIDFTKFFDTINHRELKNNLKLVLGTDELPDNWYKVFKSITQYSYVKKEKIDEYLFANYGVKELKRQLKSKKLKQIMSAKDFRKFKNDYLLKNKKPYGIPQGSGMSAVCSNVHLVGFDCEISKWAKKNNALYRRYCDDLIIVIPVDKLDVARMNSFKNEIYKIIHSFKSLGIKVQEEKTEIRVYHNNKILDFNYKPSSLDYLGFVYNGDSIQIREKSLFKYYTRAYRKANTCKRVFYKTGKKFKRNELYQIYTHLGHKYKKRGNFITYSNKAHLKMKSLNCNSKIKKQTKRHWIRVQKRLT